MLFLCPLLISFAFPKFIIVNLFLICFSLWGRFLKCWGGEVLGSFSFLSSMIPLEEVCLMVFILEMLPGPGETFDRMLREGLKILLVEIFSLFSRLNLVSELILCYITHYTHTYILKIKFLSSFLSNLLIQITLSLLPLSSTPFLLHPTLLSLQHQWAFIKLN